MLYNGSTQLQYQFGDTTSVCVLRGNEQWQQSTRLVNRFSIRLQIPLTHTQNTINCSTAKETKEAEDKSRCLSVEQQKETTAMAGIFHPQPQRQENKKKTQTNSLNFVIPQLYVLSVSRHIPRLGICDRVPHSVRYQYRAESQYCAAMGM